MSLTQFTVPSGQGAFGYSKYLYDVVTSFVSHANANVQAQNTKNSALSTQLSTSITSAAQDRASIRSEVDASFSDVSTRIDGVDASINAINAWITNNTDEIQGEVDKAINAKVSQTAYDTVVTQLENADSTLTQSLSTAIADRQQKDVEHDGKLDKIEAFISALLSTYHLEDASGNVLSEMDDF